MDTLKILIVDDEVILAETMKRELLGMGYPDSDRCKDFHEAEILLKSGVYNLAILDINLSGGHEGILLGQLCTELGIPFFFITSYSDRNTIREAAGTRPGTYLIKPFLPEEILAAIEVTLMHQQPEIRLKLKKAAAVFELSSRETEMLDLVYRRLSYQEISEQLYVSVNTVKSHVKKLYYKMGVSSRQQLIEVVQELQSK